MKLVKIGKVYLDMDGGLSAHDNDNVIFVGTMRELSEQTTEKPCPYINEAENVKDFRAWLDRNSDDISKRGGIGPQTTASVRQ